MISKLSAAFKALASDAKMDNRLRMDEPLSRHTSLRIGGPAAIWAEVDSIGELEAILSLARGEGLAIHLVGLGSNVLFGDDGVMGVVLRLGGELAGWERVAASGDKASFWVGGGAINAHLVKGLLKQGFVGAEFLSLIPGTLGGAIALNAGTKEHEIESILQSVDLMVFNTETGRWQRQTVERSGLSMSYRHAELPEDAIVVAGCIEVVRGDVDAARKNIRFDKDRRNETQPYRLASVGSTFANPTGDFAGRLIEAVGLKGVSIGGARISPLHANFFINEAEASAKDFLSLMALARVRVRRSFGVELRPEVRFVGFDGWSQMLEIERDLERHGC
ncbi:MAG: UDP-N-acetylmuramate dehydrogenase [Bradymonadaceae bacterium]|nr:UDP-N-acetylmuramate dehydrogenase [Lujinxingiaceae bacterium]